MTLTLGVMRGAILGGGLAKPIRNIPFFDRLYTPVFPCVTCRATGAASLGEQTPYIGPIGQFWATSPMVLVSSRSAMSTIGCNEMHARGGELGCEPLLVRLD